MNRPNASPITLGPSASLHDTGRLRVSGVTFGYGQAGQSPAVLSGVSATLRPGRVTAVLGPNASGKSTLVRVMLGQLRSWSGAVELDGRPVGELVGRPMARRVSYVPQRGGLSFAFTVRQVVAMGRFAFGDEAYVDAAIERGGLADVANRSFHELSGGQQQRVLIARAWAQSRPPEAPARGKNGEAEGTNGEMASANVVLADEPVSSLDLRHAQEAMGLFAEMAAEGLAVLVVLHGLDLAARWADEVWLMNGGRIVAAGEADDVLRPEVLSPVYGVELVRVEHGGQMVLLPTNGPSTATRGGDGDTLG